RPMSQLALRRGGREHECRLGVGVVRGDGIGLLPADAGRVHDRGRRGRGDRGRHRLGREGGAGEDTGSPPGAASTRFMPVDADGPRFATASVYVSVPPATTGSGSSDVAIDRSASTTVPPAG